MQIFRAKLSYWRFNGHETKKLIAKGSKVTRMASSVYSSISMRDGGKPVKFLGELYINFIYPDITAVSK